MILDNEIINAISGGSMNHPIQNTTVIMGGGQLPPKSVGTALLLALIFGPLGLLYASVPGGVIMLVVSLIVVPLTLGLGLVITWPACIIWAVLAVNKHNERMVSLSGNVPTAIHHSSGADEDLGTAPEDMLQPRITESSKGESA